MSDSIPGIAADLIDFDDDLIDFDGELYEPGVATAYEDAGARSALLSKLIERRMTAHLRQADVAQAMGTTQSFVSDFENGKTDPHFSTLQRYARAVGAQLSVLVHAPIANTGTAGQWGSGRRVVQKPVVHRPLDSGFATQYLAKVKRHDFARAA